MWLGPSYHKVSQKFLHLTLGSGGELVGFEGMLISVKTMSCCARGFLPAGCPGTGV